LIIKTFPNVTKRKGNNNDNSRLNIITQRYHVTTQTAYNNKGALAMTDNIFQTLHELAGQDEILIRSLTDTERNPENFKYWLALADALVKRNMYELAIRCFGKATSLDTRSRQAWYIKGNPLRINQPIRHYEDQVLECYDKSIEIDPNFIDAWNNKGLALHNLALGNLKKYKEAIECYDKAIEIDPNFIEPYLNKANALLYLKYYDQARECNKKAMDLNHAWDNWD
jgi:tetratricopeptide (TPR) repeat protein